MIVYFANANSEREISIDDFYNEYYMIKTKISKDLNVKNLLAVPLEQDLLR